MTLLDKVRSLSPDVLETITHQLQEFPSKSWAGFLPPDIKRQLAELGLTGTIRRDPTSGLAVLFHQIGAGKEGVSQHAVCLLKDGETIANRGVLPHRMFAPNSWLSAPLAGDSLVSMTSYADGTFAGPQHYVKLGALTDTAPEPGNVAVSALLTSAGITISPETLALANLFKGHARMDTASPFAHVDPTENQALHAVFEPIPNLLRTGQEVTPRKALPFIRTVVGAEDPAFIIGAVGVWASPAQHKLSKNAALQVIKGLAKKEPNIASQEALALNPIGSSQPLSAEMHRVLAVAAASGAEGPQIVKAALLQAYKDQRILLIGNEQMDLLAKRAITANKTLSGTLNAVEYLGGARTAIAFERIAAHAKKSPAAVLKAIVDRDMTGVSPKQKARALAIIQENRHLDPERALRAAQWARGKSDFMPMDAAVDLIKTCGPRCPKQAFETMSFLHYDPAFPVDLALNFIDTHGTRAPKEALWLLGSMANKEIDTQTARRLAGPLIRNADPSTVDFAIYKWVEAGKVPRWKANLWLMPKDPWFVVYGLIDAVKWVMGK